MRIHHIALRTHDVARLVAFYAETLGLPIMNRTGDTSAWLQAGEAIVMLERAEAGEPLIVPGTRELVAFAAEPGELPLFEQRLAAGGIPLEARTAFTLYFRDPDGRRIGVSQYPHPAGEGI
jgi:catechol 2,3-dioxygenase-like lactoylglutathione lyase family enzyme